MGLRNDLLFSQSPFLKSKIMRAPGWMDRIVTFAPSEVKGLKKASDRSGLSMDDILELAIDHFLRDEDKLLNERGLSLSQELAYRIARVESQRCRK